MVTKKIVITTVCVALMAIGAGWRSVTAWADDPFEEMSIEGRPYVRGLVSSVSVDSGQLSVRPLKGKRLVLLVGPQTVLEGFSRLDELQKKDQVKVWYTVEGEENRAVRVEKVLDLGC